MKTWKIIAAAAFALVAVASISATALAFMGGQSTYDSNASNRDPQGPRGGMMQGTMGGMMGGADPTYGGYRYPDDYQQQGGQGTAGSHGCH